MKQRIVVAKPPVYDRCVAMFGAGNIVGKPILWAWGDIIYNPLDADIPREILAHETVHGCRQLDDVLMWWDKYLLDRDFRFSEEVIAHQAEWQSYRRWHPGQDNQGALEVIAGKLASPLYGNMVDLNTARTNVMLRV